MAELTAEQISQIKGSFVIRCVKSGGYTMTAYGQYAWAEDEEKDLMDATLPATLKAGDYHTARNMCRDPARELAQAITAGDFVVVSERFPIMDPLLIRE